MVDSFLVIGVLLAHFGGDFLLQSDQMAIRKSSSLTWLSIHVGVYSAFLFILLGWKFAVVNGVAHWVVDLVTSKINSRLWKAEERHWFFTMIGFDQFLHVAILVATIPLIAIPF